MSSYWQIFALGTNNWQSKEQFAPGSGILHEGQHIALNALPNVECYSMWPSDIQKSPKDRDDYRIYELTKQIPICESVGPQSSRRWHSMSDEEIAEYRERLIKEVLEYLDYVEKKTGKPFNLFMAHHTFMNPVVMVQVNEMRVANGQQAVPIVVFAHGTALKMYQNEINKLPEFPMKFYTWVREELKIFEGASKIAGVFAVSKPQQDTFCEVFPAFPRDRVAVTPCGYNQLIFHPIEGCTRENVFGELPQVLYDAFDPADFPETYKGRVAPGLTVPDLDSYDKVVVFCGRFADWKRLDTVLLAAKKWETENADKKILTLIFGGGSQEARKKYIDMAYKELNLQHTFVLGPQGQDVLAKVYTVTDVSVFPSKDEPFGLVFIECMGCGTPVIGAKSGGPLDFVTPEVGTLVDEGTNEEVSHSVYDAVLRAVTEDWKKAKGPTCLKYALDKFSLTTQANLMLQFVQSHFLK